jgi:hypothetical protein
MIQDGIWNIYFCRKKHKKPKDSKTPLQWWYERTMLNESDVRRGIVFNGRLWFRSRNVTIQIQNNEHLQCDRKINETEREARTSQTYYWRNVSGGSNQEPYDSLANE